MTELTQPETVQPTEAAPQSASANKVITTPIAGAQIELKPYITGFDKEAIESVFYEASSVQQSTTGGDAKIEFDVPAIARANRKTIERVVISVNGSTDNVVDAVLSLHVEDYQFVVTAVNEITNGNSAEKKSS